MPTPTAEGVGEWMHSKESALSTTWGIHHSWASTAFDGLPLEIVKMADTIEAISFLEDDAIGDHARRVQQALYDRLDARIINAAVRFPRMMWAEAVKQTLRDALVMGGSSHD